MNTKPWKLLILSNQREPFIAVNQVSSLFFKIIFKFKFTENFRYWCPITALWLFCFCLFSDKVKISHLDREPLVLFKDSAGKGHTWKIRTIILKLKISRTPMNFKWYLIEYIFVICFLTQVCIVSQFKGLYRWINDAMIPVFRGS